ncbi:hypothetical protein HS088_TW16G00905 [Tripterygium wilfordii]|uniref:MINDY deubiquitinase domain-containing protein n=1 Tax=Tripterygium wilfordii TaxID=458696 RepID=A0A7J7CKE7_TRIWF|nr:ubiquitin carboxyl-terminal hydrolase MINDY-1-like [Tripterygium wilfordii]KAF5734456.1 hypothetical protein HS088_TW16G00905 [Tripterygium wilfordii]
MASSPSTSEEPRQEPPPPPQQEEEGGVKECIHKTKTIQFLGRTTPIVLQNDNGPCPLLAICNVLLLRNNLNLSPDIAEVSQEKLLSLVAERLIDSNSDVHNKDAGYVENQQQNIADAIDLLPRLATGIDVNIKFRKVDDFEFTRECAIFDLLDIPLYHGWIVDPQDYETTNAIGSKSYNELTGELVALETRNADCKCSNNPEEDSIDFAAATTATLGVPSPCLSNVGSFDESPHSVSDHKSSRIGDLEEEEELQRALKLSEAEPPASDVDSVLINASEGTMSVRSGESTCSKEFMPVDSVDSSEQHVGSENQSFCLPDPFISDNHAISSNGIKNAACFEAMSKERASPPSQVNLIELGVSSDAEHIGFVPSNDVVENSGTEKVFQMKGVLPRKDIAHVDDSSMEITQGCEKVGKTSVLVADYPSGCDIVEASPLSAQNADSDSSNDRTPCTDVSETVASSVGDSEPMYEGEECILDSAAAVYEDREPVYEGEVVLAEQADESTLAASRVISKDEITTQQGELIRNFLRNNASQLTFYGLFCLQDGLKERELCVFFRNNHFSTMFKYEGELYLLATDQGYINQPDLVWEKLNEVNGDTLFMMSNFKEFKVDNRGNDTWDERNAMASTADYLASVDSAAHAGLDINSDLQLAIALQQQEFEQQPQQQNLQQQSISDSSRLIIGPQAPRSSTGRSSSSSPKPDSKAKDKCIVM